MNATGTVTMNASATTPETPTYHPDQEVYRYVKSAALGREPQPLTVVRVNRVSVTVRTRDGRTLRLRPEQIEGPADDAVPAAPSAPPVAAVAHVIPLDAGTARRPVVRARSAAGPRTLAPANVRVTQWFASHLGAWAGASPLARELGCTVAEVTRMCARLVAAGLMVRRGSRYTLVLPAGVSVTVVT